MNAVMFLLHKNKLAAALVVALLSATAVAAPLANAGVPGGPQPRPLMQLAIPPRATRARRRRWYAAVRAIRGMSPRRLRDGGLRRWPRAHAAPRRRPRRAWYARGPPARAPELKQTRAGVAEAAPASRRARRALALA
jgi:hypothetical protein